MRTAEFQVSGSGAIQKINAEKRQAFGWAYMSSRGGKDVIDHSGEHIPIEEIEKAVYPFVRAGAVAGIMHGRTGVGSLIESMVFTPEKIKAMGLPEDTPQGWWVGFEYHDDAAWQGVKSGRYEGFSIHGKGMRTKVTKRREEERNMTELTHLVSGVELDELSIVDLPDDPEARILLWKRVGEEGQMRTSLGKSRSELVEDHAALCSMYQQRGMTPAEAWIAASESETGQVLKALYLETPPESRPVVKHEDETPQRAPEVTTLAKRADEIREKAARLGEPIDPATAFARACDENPKLVRSYYNR